LIITMYSEEIFHEANISGKEENAERSNRKILLINFT